MMNNRVPEVVEESRDLGHEFHGWATPDGKSHVEIIRRVEQRLVDFYGHVSYRIVEVKQEVNALPTPMTSNPRAW